MSKKTQFSLDDSVHTSNLPMKAQKCAKFPWNRLKRTKKHLGTGQNGQKRTQNHLKVTKFTSNCWKMYKIILELPENDQKHLGTVQNGQKRPKNHLKKAKKRPEQCLKIAICDRLFDATLRPTSKFTSKLVKMAKDGLKIT